MNNPPGKLCPRCQTLTGLAAPSCLACGHVYRTHFTPPGQEPTTQKGQPPAATDTPPYPATPLAQWPATTKRRPPLYAVFMIVGGIFVFGAIGTCTASFVRFSAGYAAYNAEKARPGHVASLRDVSPTLIHCGADQVKETFGEPETNRGGVWTWPADNGGRITVTFSDGGQGVVWVSSEAVTDNTGQEIWRRQE